MKTYQPSPPGLPPRECICTCDRKGCWKQCHYYEGHGRVPHRCKTHLGEVLKKRRDRSKVWWTKGES